MLTESEKLAILGKNIARARKMQDLSQCRLSEILNISREHLAKIETAKRGVSLSLLFRICDTLDVTESEIFKPHPVKQFNK